LVEKFPIVLVKNATSRVRGDFLLTLKAIDIFIFTTVVVETNRKNSDNNNNNMEEGSNITNLTNFQ